MTARYRFHHTVEVSADPQRLADLVADLAHYPRWWPQVVAVADLGHDRAWVVCRSRLPYSLDLVLTAVTRTLPVLEVRVAGDLEGWVRVRITPRGDGALVEFEQEVVVAGWLGAVSPVLRPILRWNHDAMMRGFSSGLRASTRPRT